MQTTREKLIEICKDYTITNSMRETMKNKQFEIFLNEISEKIATDMIKKHNRRVDMYRTQEGIKYINPGDLFMLWEWLEFY